MRFFFLLIFCFCIQCVYGQVRSCGNSMPQLFNSTFYNQRNYDSKKAKIKQSQKVACDSLIIPMAFHFMETTADRACLESLVLEQVSIINDDFQGNNQDRKNFDRYESQYPNTRLGKSCIRFFVADQNHPVPSLSDGQLAITINMYEPTDFLEKWAGYLNVFVREVDQSNTILGYSPLGGYADGDGIVIAKWGFGGKAWCGDISLNNNFDLGRTLTHEMGHYFLLPHIWGNDQGCDSDDGIMDTPLQDHPWYRCTQASESTCESTDMAMNFMDYADDPCMYAFTQMQVSQMEAYVSSNLSHLIINAYDVVSNLGYTKPDTVVLPIDTIVIAVPDTVVLPIDTTTVEKPDTVVPNTQKSFWQKIIGLLKFIFSFFK